MLTLNPVFVHVEDSNTTRSLLERAQGGETDAFCELCRIYEVRLLRQAMRLVSNATLAEDLAQDTLVEGWKSLQRYNGRCQFFTWLCAIMLNRYRNTLRERRLIQIWPTANTDPESHGRIERLIDPENSPDQAAEARDQAAVILDCINALPPKQQQVIYLRFYVDESLESVAAALNCSVGTVKSRLFHALEKLRLMPALTKPLPPIEERMKAKMKVESV